MSDIQSLYFNAIKLLKHLRQAGIIKHVETRKDYKLKATKLSYTYLELQPNQGFYLHFHKDHKYAITSLSQGHQFIGRFNQQGLADIKIPQKWAAIDDWQLTTSAVEHSFIQEYFSQLNLSLVIAGLNAALLNQPTSAASTFIAGIIGHYYGNEIKSTIKQYEHQIIGGAQALGGALTVIAAGAIEVGTLGSGTPLAITLGFIGSDNMAAGISRMLTDKEVNTLGEDIIAWSGMVPKGYEGITYGLIDLTLGSKAVTLSKLPSAVNQVSIRYLATNEAKHSPLQKVELIVDKLSKNTSSKRHVIQYKPDEMVTKKIDSIVKAESNDAVLGAGKGTSGSDLRKFQIADRVYGQLNDPRMGSLAGKLTEIDLQRLANNPNATRVLDTRTGHINVIQEIDGKLIRITTPKDEMKIISVGPIRNNQVNNLINKGDFVPLNSGGK